MIETKSMIQTRTIQRSDYEAWLQLWEGYNAFYGRSGETALPQTVTDITWERFFNPLEPVHAHVAEDGQTVVGIAHFLYHRSTTRIESLCYLQDLFTSPSIRRRGVARALIESVQREALAAGVRRIYWQTHYGNNVARGLYDKVAQHHGFIVYALDALP
jgi:GNAT superfamily N-acetyltransferase